MNLYIFQNPTIMWVIGMSIVKVDNKGRVQLPKNLRMEFKLKSGQSLLLRKKGEGVLLSKVTRLDPHTDPLLRDILLHPLKSKVKVTKELLDKLEEEQWSS